MKHDATLLVADNQDRIVRNNLTQQIDGNVKTKIGKDSVTEVAGSQSVKVTGDTVLETTASISQKAAVNLDAQVGAQPGDRREPATSTSRRAPTW